MPDAYLAALAIELSHEWATTDRDFRTDAEISVAFRSAKVAQLSRSERRLYDSY